MFRIFVGCADFDIDREPAAVGIYGNESDARNRGFHRESRMAGPPEVSSNLTLPNGPKLTGVEPHATL